MRYSDIADYTKAIEINPNYAYNNRGISKKNYKIKASSDIQALKKDPDYIFREPPSSIRVKSGNSRTHWHLKR